MFYAECQINRGSCDTLLHYINRYVQKKNADAIRMVVLKVETTNEDSPDDEERG